MCCFSVADVFLEDPPPEKKKVEVEEKVKKNYILASDQLNLQPIVSVNAAFPFSLFISHFSFLFPPLNFPSTPLRTPSKYLTSSTPPCRPPNLKEFTNCCIHLPTNGTQSLDQPTSRCTYLEHESPLCLPSSERWQCKIIPSVTCSQPVNPKPVSLYRLLGIFVYRISVCRVS